MGMLKQKISAAGCKSAVVLDYQITLSTMQDPAFNSLYTAVLRVPMSRSPK